jgi:hypothetical protein
VRSVADKLPPGLKGRLTPLVTAERVFPDFVGIGAQKAGTTWLSYNLQLHPEIWMPKIKELHYFNERINDPKNSLSRLYGKITGEGTVNRRWRRQVRSRLRRHRKRFKREEFLWDLKYYAGTPSDRWYISLFQPGRGKVKGEITPAYSMLGHEGVARVHDLLPDAKLIFMMRNPIERAWSQLAMRFHKAGKRSIGSIRHRGLQRNFEKEGNRARTDYLQTLEDWSAFYPQERIFVGFLEDIHFYPAQLLGSVYEFLGGPHTNRISHLSGTALRGGALPPERELRWLRLVLAVLRREAGRKPARSRIPAVPIVGIGYLGGVDQRRGGKVRLPERTSPRHVIPA